jgi:anaerobic selenocysteine-containing dehydrogenase
LPEESVVVARSYCRICTSQCGILVDVAAGEVVRVRGDRDHPLSQGYTCAKGRALPAMHHHPRRIVRPLMWTDGALRPASWDACLDDLGGRLREIIARHGPSAVGVFFGSGLGMDAAGYRMAEALQASLPQPATGAGELRAAVAPYTLGHAAAVAGVPAPELADLVAAVRRAGRVAIETGTGVMSMLTSHQEADPVTGMARYSGVPVGVHAAR